MSIAAISQPLPAPMVRTPEAKEGPGPDHDGDADDAGKIAATPAAPPGMGTAVNTSA